MMMLLVKFQKNKCLSRDHLGKAFNLEYGFSQFSDFVQLLHNAESFADFDRFVFGYDQRKLPH